MQVLNRKLTEKTEQIVSSALAGLPVTVQFKDIKDIGRSSYGSTDCSQYRKGYCTIYLNLEQNTLEFETTILHELRHIWQVGKGYPFIHNKTVNSVFQTEPAFYENLGSQIQSVVLDLDVIQYLKKLGYLSSIFSAYSDTDDLSYKFSAVSNQSIQAPWNLASAVLSLYTVFIRADELSKPVILRAADAFPKIIEECKLIEREISTDLCNDPLYCAKAMGWIIDHFSLWTLYLVVYRGKRIRTHNEYLNLLAMR